MHFVNNLRQILLLYRNQLAGLKCKSVDWFLYSKSIDLRQEKKMLFGLADFATGFANLFFHIFFSLENNQISQPQIAI